jgi:hypothetical protein
MSSYVVRTCAMRYNILSFYLRIKMEQGLE